MNTERPEPKRKTLESHDQGVGNTREQGIELPSQTRDIVLNELNDNLCIG